MAWAFKASPHIRKRFKAFDEEVYYLRLLRWLTTLNNTKVKAHELFDPPEDEIVYPWLIPSDSEKEMDFWTRFMSLEQKEEDLKIVRLVTDLTGVTTIKRDVVVDTGVGASDGVGFDAEVGVDAGVGGAESVVGVDVAETADGEKAIVGYRGGFSPLSGGGDFGTLFTIGKFDRLGVGTSKALCNTCSCETCNERTDKMMKMMVSHNERMNNMMEMMLSFQETLNTVLSKRGVIPSSRLVSLYTSICEQKRRKQVSKALMSAMKKATSVRKTQQAVVIEEEQQAAVVIEEQQVLQRSSNQQQVLRKRSSNQQHLRRSNT